MVATRMQLMPDLRMLRFRALSGHKTAAMITVYAKKTKDQACGSAETTRSRRTKRGNLSE